VEAGSREKAGKKSRRPRKKKKNRGEKEGTSLIKIQVNVDECLGGKRRKKDEGGEGEGTEAE